MRRLYIRRVLDSQLDLLDHTQLQCIRSYSSLQFTTTLAESSHCIFTGFLSSNIAGSVRLQLCNSSLKTADRPEYSLVTVLNSKSRLGNSARTPWLNWLMLEILTNWRSSSLYIVSRGPLLWHDVTRHVVFVARAPARAPAILFTSPSAILLTSHYRWLLPTASTSQYVPWVSSFALLHMSGTLSLVHLCSKCVKFRARQL
jgi:hypothetical protein